MLAPKNLIFSLKKTPLFASKSATYWHSSFFPQLRNHVRVQRKKEQKVDKQRFDNWSCYVLGYIISSKQLRWSSRCQDQGWQLVRWKQNLEWREQRLWNQTCSDLYALRLCLRKLCSRCQDYHDCHLQSNDYTHSLCSWYLQRTWYFRTSSRRGRSDILERRNDFHSSFDQERGWLYQLTSWHYPHW